MAKDLCVKAASCGNAFLFGEYAVLVNGPAIIAGLSGPLTARASFSKKDSITSSLFKDPVMAKSTLDYFREKHGCKENVSIFIDSKVPPNKGFGSSDACIVSTYGALLGLFSIKLSKKKVLNELFEFKSKNKVCSIGALAASVYGGLVKTKRNKVIETAPLRNPNNYLFTYSGIHGHGVIKEFLKKYEAEEECRSFVKEINKITNSAWRERKSLARIGARMESSMPFFDYLGATNESLSRLLSESKRCGALGGKISGGGQGDCIVSVAKGNLKGFEERNECYRFGHTNGLSVVKE